MFSLLAASQRLYLAMSGARKCHQQDDKKGQKHLGEAQQGFPSVGVPLYRWMVFVNGKIPSRMDENWGYPYVRKPPYIGYL